RHRVHLALDAGLRERDIREPENLLDDASPRGARLGAASPAAASSSPEGPFVTGAQTSPNLRWLAGTVQPGA
ncbi:MAG: hypothetical protein ACYDCK_14350, partial [Thermoplasmatota archaeon]